MKKVYRYIGEVLSNPVQGVVVLVTWIGNEGEKGI